MFVEPVLQGLVRKVRLAHQPGIDGILVEEFLADMGIVPHRDEFQLGKLVDLAFGQPGIAGQVVHVHRFFAVAQKFPDVGEQAEHVLVFFHDVSFNGFPQSRVADMATGRKAEILTLSEQFI